MSTGSVYTPFSESLTRSVYLKEERLTEGGSIFFKKENDYTLQGGGDYSLLVFFGTVEVSATGLVPIRET